MTAHLRPFDLAIVAAYLIGITLFGLRFREKKGAARQDKSLRSYFLADNTIPWWAISLSIVSAETSTLTIISIPGVAFAGDFGFLQIVLGYLLGRIVVAALFLPRYFRGEMMTAYQLIDRRFGHVLHKVTAGLFLLTRAAAEGVRVFAVSIVVGIAIGTRDVLSIAIISSLTLLYTFEGGMAAVIWTDVVQMAIYIGGTFVAIWSLGHHIGADRGAIAGWFTIHAVAGHAGKFHMFNFALNLTTTYTFWAGILGGTFLTMASHGTDQLMVQRMLAARSLRESRLALLSSGVVIFIQFALFLLIGAGLFVFAQPATTLGAPFMAKSHLAMSGLTGASWIQGLAPDRIFPTFIVRELPVGIAGLLVAAILAAAMSNLSAALNSLSSTTVVDFYMHLRPHADSRERNLISKSSTVLWALVLFAIAVYSLSVGGKGHVVEIGLSIASVAYGCLLGVFLLGTLTKFATQTGATLGMICGFALNLYLWQGTFPKTILSGDPYACETFHTYRLTCVPTPGITIPHIAFTWYVLIGALVTFAIGALFSLFFRKQSHRTAALSLLLLFCLSFPKGICVSAHAQGPADRTPEYPEASASGVIAQGGNGALAPRFAFSTAAADPAAPDFTPITTLLNDAIAAHKLPGAVVLIGHNGKVVFEQAYGDRKLAGEPGLDGKPSPAEPMTEDTIFDMASLTKCLATATAVMQLYEQGKIASFDDPIAKYLPEFLTSPSAASNTTSPASTPNTANPPSANGATTSQPSPKGWVRAQEKPQRAESPTQNAPTFDKSRVTIRMLLTHTSGEAPDIDLRDPWGLAALDRAEGLRRALTTPLKAAPGTHFEYSDINFILLGDLVETLSGQREDDYAAEHIFKPLGMTDTRYHAADRTCGTFGMMGARVLDMTGANPALTGATQRPCTNSTWRVDTEDLTAPTAHDDESKSHPELNPDFDHLLRGTVHDPTTRRMGGVAGHAGVFSTAHDISLYASALLEKLLHNTGPFPLKQSTLQLMTQPEQPGHAPDQLAAANAAEQAAIEHALKGTDTALKGTGFSPSISAHGKQGALAPEGAGASAPTIPGLAPHYPAIQGQNLRGFGWDIDTAFSKPRGAIFPIGSFGHTGFTGTSLWMDPASDTYVILLANAIHPRGNPPISNLRGQVATAAAHALGLDHPNPVLSTSQPNPNSVILSEGAGPHPAPQSKDPEDAGPATASNPIPTPNQKTPPVSPTSQQGLVKGTASAVPQNAPIEGWALAPEGPTLTGIDVLEQTHFAALKDLHHIAVFTNQSGLDAQGHRTIDILASLTTSDLRLTTLFTPEHGLSAQQDTTHLQTEKDQATHLPIISLYGAHDADRRPTHTQLKDLDAVVIDLQDAGVHFWTYEAAMGYFLEAAAEEQTKYHHTLTIILLDRPNPVGGLAVQGPVSDPGRESYINYMSLPVRHGLTLGELARYIVATKLYHGSATNGYPEPSSASATNGYPEPSSASATNGYPEASASGLISPPKKDRGFSPGVHLIVVPMQHWQRSQFYADTGLPWVNPSPNLRGPEAALRYPALGLIEYNNLSVGRGTDHPFSFFGAGIPPTKPSTSTATGGLADPGPGLNQPPVSNQSAVKGTASAVPLNAAARKGALAPGGAWFKATEVANYLTARNIPGVTFTPTSETIAEDANHYPYHGQTIEAVRVTVTDPRIADTPELGIEILAALHHLYPTQFNLPRAMPLVCNQATMDALTRGDDPRAIAATWQPALAAFRAATAPYLLYPY